MKKLKEILIAGVVLFGTLLPMSMTAGRAMAKVDTTEEENARVAITRIVPEQDKIAIKMLTEHYTGRAKSVTIWRWKDEKKQDRAAKVYKCGELKKNPEAEVLFESCDLKKEDWYENFNRFFEVWMKVPEGSLRKNYQMRLNVTSTFALEGSVSRAFNVAYADCFDGLGYIDGVECVREVVERIDGVYETYVPREIGVTREATEKRDGKYDWEDNRLKDERMDRVEIEKFNIFNGEMALKYYDDETVKKRETKREFGSEGEKLTPGETGEILEDLEKKFNEKIEEIRIFYTGDERWRVIERTADLKMIYSGEITSEMRKNGQILINVGEKMKENYRGVIYVDVKMKGGRRILQKVGLKECLTLDNFGEGGKEVCVKKYDEFGRTYYGIFGDEVKYGLRRAEKWEKESEIKQNRELLEKLMKEAEKFENEKKKKEEELTKIEAEIAKNQKKIEQELAKLKAKEEKMRDSVKKAEERGKKSAEKRAEREMMKEKRKIEVENKKKLAEMQKIVTLREKDLSKIITQEKMINLGLKNDNEKLKKLNSGLAGQVKLFSAWVVDPENAKKMSKKEAQLEKSEDEANGDQKVEKIDEKMSENSDEKQGKEEIPVPNTGGKGEFKMNWIFVVISGLIAVVMTILFVIFAKKKFKRG